MHYFAYGSNLWLEQMRSRCPESRLVGRGRLDGYRWLITGRGYASIVVSSDDTVYGSVYLLSKTDERLLDRYEGVSQGHYRKEQVEVEVEGELLRCLTYIDPVEQPGQPQAEYVDRINSGLADAKLPQEYVTGQIRRFVPDNGA